jgi:hypothetical protein
MYVSACACAIGVTGAAVVGMGHLACVTSLLHRGADPTLLDCDKWTPLDLAKQDLMASPNLHAIVLALQQAMPAGGGAVGGGGGVGSAGT